MRVGVDLGGTKIEIMALGHDGAVLARERAPTPAGDYDATIRAIGDLVRGVEGRLGRSGTVGLATPGALSAKTGLIKNSNSVVLNGRPLDRDLAAHLGRPIRMENDANCLALSEAVDGAAAGARVVFAVILGTGVGGGLAIDRSVVTGRNRIAGEWGHNPLPWPNADETPGHPCYCSKTGCIETMLSGAGLARDFTARTRRTLPAHDIAAAAANGDADARAVLRTYQDRLARGLASVINVVDPDVIVFGGGLSNIDAIYGGLEMQIARYAFTDALETCLARALHGDSSGVRGAAWLWPVDR